MNYRGRAIIFLLLGVMWLVVGFEFRHPEALYDEPERSQLELGRREEQKRKYDQAEEHYLQIDNIIVRNMTLNQLSAAWDGVNANIIRAQEVVRQQPHLATARATLARHYYNKGLLCKQYIDTAAGDYPRDFVFEEREYYFIESLRQAEKVLQMEPNLTEAQLLIGEIYSANARYDDALRNLKRLISKHPDHAKGYYAIGKIYLDTKQYDKVERYFIRTIKLDPNFIDAYYLLGQFYYEQQWFEYAAYTFLEILRRKPQDTPSMELLLTSSHKLGDYYVEQGEYSQGIRLYQEILELESSYEVYQSLLNAEKKQAEAALEAGDVAKKPAEPPEEAGKEEQTPEAPQAEAVSPSPEQETDSPSPEQEDALPLPEEESFSPLPETVEKPAPEEPAPETVEELAPEEPAAQEVAAVSLRNTPQTLLNRDVIRMIQNRGFNHPNNLATWELSGTFQGNFQHKYEAQTVNDINVVVDHVTGLMWQQAGSAEKMNWAAAREYIQQLNQSEYGGHPDWRLPTVEELASLLEFDAKNGNAYIDPVFDASLDFCWSSDTTDNANDAWTVAFHSGYVYFDPQAQSHYVRMVRTVR